MWGKALIREQMPSWFWHLHCFLILEWKNKFVIKINELTSNIQILGEKKLKAICKYTVNKRKLLLTGLSFLPRLTGTAPMQLRENEICHMQTISNRARTLHWTWIRKGWAAAFRQGWHVTAHSKGSSGFELYYFTARCHPFLLALQFYIPKIEWPSQPSHSVPLIPPQIQLDNSPLSSIFSWLKMT